MLAVGVIPFAMIQGPSFRHLAGAVILIVLGAVQLKFAFSQKDLEEELGIRTDERAQFIVMKSGHMTLKILNGLLLAGVFATLLGYALTETAVWLAAALTLWVVDLAILVVLLAVNCYYEKKY